MSFSYFGQVHLCVTPTKIQNWTEDKTALDMHSHVMFLAFPASCANALVCGAIM